MVEVPRLKIGIVSDIHLQYAFDPNDPKKQGMSSSQTFEHALAYFRDQGVDGVVVAGDLTEYGRLCELEASGIAWNRVFPGGKGIDGKPVAKLIIRGNHDKMDGRPAKDGSEKEPLVRDDPTGAFKKVYGIDDYAPIMMRQVNGYKFVLVNWGSEDEAGEWIRKHAAELPKDRPFFYVQHPHLKGTNIASMDHGKATEALKAFPNAVAFSGHSHLSLTLGSQIWQDSFTAVGTSCLQWINTLRDRDNARRHKGILAHTPAADRKGRQGLLMTVYDDRIVLKRREFLTDCDVGPDWVIPLDGSKPYGWKVQKDRSVAPEFAKDATARIDRKMGANSAGEKEMQLQVVFPRPLPAVGDRGRTIEYEATVFRADEDESKPLLVRRVYAERFFLADGFLSKTGLVCFAESELPRGVRLRFAVRALNDWEVRGNPIYGEYTPELKSE